FGREGKSRSHWLYQVDTPPKTAKFADSTATASNKRVTLVELRSTGAQTVMPPSRHATTGEAIRWDADGDPAQVSGTWLLESVQALAAAALLVRHWQEGIRQDAALALTGALLRLGWISGQIERFISA